MNLSNIVCFNSSDSNSYVEKNMIVIYDCMNDKHLAELKFNLNVHNFRIKSDYLIVVWDFKIKIFSIYLNWKLVECILYNCEYYSFNIFDINSCFKNHIFAISNDINKGTFIVHKINFKNDLGTEIKEFESKNKINGHKDRIEFIKLNYTGEYVATMSKKGTNLKIFNVKLNQLIFRFKRGIENSELPIISFDLSTNFIAIYTNKGTIHIWDLTKIYENSNLEKLFKINYHKDNFNFKFKKDLKGWLTIDKNNKLIFWDYEGIRTNFKLDNIKNEWIFLNVKNIIDN